MDHVRVKTRTGGDAVLDAPAQQEFQGTLRGELLTPRSPGYDEARSIWNAMIDRRPGLIARCRSAGDVIQTVRFARKHDLLVAVRGGGHNIAGNAICEGGLVVDLSGMKSIRVDPTKRTALVEPGCTLADFDQDTQVFGLATPVGINSTTGIAGLTLGGGFGWLSRKYGLTVDNLLSADVVTAEGEFLRASESENRDLFWGLRGGSGNLGIVTSFEYRLHPVGPEVLSGLVVHPFEDAAKVFAAYRDFVAKAPDELTVWVVLRQAPPLPFLPAQWHGKEVIILAACYVGEMEKGKALLEPLRKFGRPIADVIAPHPLVGWQKAFDPLLTSGARNYWKSHNLTQLTDEACKVLLDYTRRLPTPLCEAFVGHLGAATSRVPKEAMAYAQRDAEFVLNVHTRWEDPAQDRPCIAWAREFFDAVTPHATGGVYVNFMPEDEADRVRDAYGVNYDRMVAIKQKYDPTNFFRMNQNIRPGG